MKIRYDVLDSLSNKAQKVYLFLITQKGKVKNFDAMAAILHLTDYELGTALLEIITKTK